MISRSLASLAVICATASAHAQNYSSEDLVRRTIERRAVEAMNWGMSAVNTDLMLQEMLNKTGGQGEPGRLLVAPSRLAQPDAHAKSGCDLFQGVLQHQGCRTGRRWISRQRAMTESLNGNIVDVWQVPLEDAGPSGADAGKGGKYLLLPPGYAGPYPKAISCCGLRRSAATRCCARTSKATAMPTSPSLSPTARRSGSIRCRRLPIRRRRCSPTRRTWCSIPPSATTRASLRLSTASCRASRGCRATAR